MHGSFKKGSELEGRKLAQSVIDNFEAVKGRIKRHQERLQQAQDELAMIVGLFPELKGPEIREVDDSEKIGGTDNNDEEEDTFVEPDEDSVGKRGMEDR